MTKVTVDKIFSTKVDAIGYLNDRGYAAIDEPVFFSCDCGEAEAIIGVDTHDNMVRVGICENCCE